MSGWQDVIDAGRAIGPRDPDVPDPHVPDPHLPLSDAQVYTTLSITEVELDTANLADVSSPVDLLDDAEVMPPSRPAVGVLLHLEQAWRMRGLVKGRLMHSLCLAPGEVTQVAMVGWQRSSTGSSRTSSTDVETASRTVDRSRSTAEVTTGVANELQAGGSTTSSFSAQLDAGVGGLVGFLGASGGSSSNVGVASSVSWAVGSRDATSESRSQVHEATAQSAANVRADVATLVQEVTQSETEQFSSRVVANYNHMHALNIQYYEVLQAYDLSAEPVAAERCIFLPMAVMPFDLETVVAYSTPLAAAARAMGRATLAAAVEHNAAGNRQRTADEVARLEAGITAMSAQADALTAQLADASAQVPALVTELNAAVGAHAQAVLRLGGAISQGTGPQALQDVETALQHLRDVAARFAELQKHQQTVRDALTTQRQWLTNQTAERDALRDGAAAEVDAMLRELEESRLAFNQALWLQMDPAAVRTMVIGFEHQGESIVDTIDPVPVAVVGTYVGFRWGFPATDEGRAAADAFRARYVDQHRSAPVASYVLPTGGLFAESVLGRAVSAEKLDLTRFWHWDDDTIPLLPTAIGTLQAAQRAQRAEAVPLAAGPSGARLVALPTAPAGPSHALAGVIGASLFQDMSGADVIGDVLSAAQKVTGTGAARAQEIAHENISALLDHAESLLPQALKAVRSGEIDPSVLGAFRNALGQVPGAGTPGRGKTGAGKPGAGEAGAGETGAAGAGEAGAGEAGAGEAGAAVEEAATGTAGEAGAAEAAAGSFDAGEILGLAAEAGFLL